MVPSKSDSAVINISFAGKAKAAGECAQTTLPRGRKRIFQRPEHRAVAVKQIHGVLGKIADLDTAPDSHRARVIERAHSGFSPVLYVAWRLGPTMCASDVMATLDQALASSGLDRTIIVHRPRLLSDNGSSYVANDLVAWLEDKGMEHVRGAPYHPQTQGKIEGWHQTLKNRLLLDNYYLPGNLERQIGAFVEHYNHVRYHESIKNLTPADVYFGRAETIIAERKRIKLATIANRRLQLKAA